MSAIIDNSDIINWLADACVVPDEDGDTPYIQYTQIFQTAEQTMSSDTHRLHVYTGSIDMPGASHDVKCIRKLQTILALGEQLEYTASISKGELLTLLYEQVFQRSGVDSVDFTRDVLTGLKLNDHPAHRLLFRLAAQYLRDAIQPMQDAIEVRFSSPDDPVLLSSGSFTAVIMPMYLPDNERTE